MNTVYEESVVIRFKNVKKDFRMYFDKGNMLKERLLFPNRNRYEDRHVLKGISFECRKGETIGLIGRNGCGKSTSLKLLSKILKPNEGQVEVTGRVSSLIELGAGFHMDMTGRENIYVNASIFGLKKHEIDKRLDAIIKFSELADYIDNPVRTYSSGMYMRLAFSIAINVDADVLLIDEILAVGDASFQRKCFDKLMDIKKSGVSIVIVSHSMDSLYGICDRIIWLEEGVIKEEGKPRIVGEHYLEFMENQGERYGTDVEQSTIDMLQESISQVFPDASEHARREGNQRVHFTSFKMDKANEDGDYEVGQELNLEFSVHKEEASEKGIYTMVSFVREDGVVSYTVSHAVDRENFKLRLMHNSLASGRYFIYMDIRDEADTILDRILRIAEYNVKVRSLEDEETGVFVQPHRWE